MIPSGTTTCICCPVLGSCTTKAAPGAKPGGHVTDIDDIQVVFFGQTRKSGRTFFSGKVVRSLGDAAIVPKSAPNTKLINDTQLVPKKALTAGI
jgi:hypothetical protein